MDEKLIALEMTIAVMGLCIAAERFWDELSDNIIAFLVNKSNQVSKFSGKHNEG